MFMLKESLSDRLWQAQGGKDMSSGGFAARAQGAGDRNSNAGQQGQGGQGGQTQGGQQGQNK